MRLGARLREDEDSASFCVWAPKARAVEVLFPKTSRRVPLRAGSDGYFDGVVDGVAAGEDYLYVSEEFGRRPDPASIFQPEGVFGPSRVCSLAFDWSDDGWRAPPLSDAIVYEIHTGTFTPEGTLDAAAERLGELAALGVNTVELMPLAQFSGKRNWGYDGVFPFAVHDTYGGPAGLFRFVDAAHAAGIAVILDVVFNHLGPEGCVHPLFGPYFTDRYETAWGKALNFDGPESDAVRRHFIECALHFVGDLHVDGLRLDAVHAIVDNAATPFLEELSTAVHAHARERARTVSVIAEDDRNDSRILRPPNEGGAGMDAQWCDDFHHALHAALTGERQGYYRDFGRLEQVARSYVQGYVYSGQESAYRRRRHGRSPAGLSASRFLVCSQNHDQVGNRMLGERLVSLTDLERAKLAAGAVLLSPFVPLLFMGEEYGETAPFLYFVDHSGAELGRAVREGRAREFASFAWRGAPPDPLAEETRARSRLDWDLRRVEPHKTLLEYYRELIALRRENRASSALAHAREEERLVVVRLSRRRGESCLLLHFGDVPAVFEAALPRGRFFKRMESAESRWRGPGALCPPEVSGGPVRMAPHSVAFYVRE